MNPVGIFSSLRTTLTGLSSQMKKLNVISENIANAEVNLEVIPEAQKIVNRIDEILENPDNLQTLDWRKVFNQLYKIYGLESQPVPA